ncbi:ankyrin repeat domain-containing protein [Gemmata sp. JC717]|uniref:ankyrin repeat domain-containing protein n=1 Tax=Gemmata algarum TaxID=2975278 RepID=UPI0021BB39CC|nr:ankyrin repeat domain-containing protein [Gemmata algarum]MDY3557209.1 ankyrin repeat domain-containing protein [Gemmata algarum]
MAKSLQWRLLDAIFSEDPKLVRQLLAAGASPNGTVEWMLPLVEACRTGNAIVVQILLDAGADIGMQDDQSAHNALTVSCEVARLPLVRTLLARGANANVLRRGVSCPLTDAAFDKAKRRADIVRALLSAGANPRTVFYSQNGVPVSDVLMVCCDSGSVECITLLLDAGADVNACYFFGTPLIAAVRGNRPDVVSLLLARGADTTPRLADDTKLGPLSGKNARDIAVSKQLKTLVSLLNAA